MATETLAEILEAAYRSPESWLTADVDLGEPIPGRECYRESRRIFAVWKHGDYEVHEIPWWVDGQPVRRRKVVHLPSRDRTIGGANDVIGIADTPERVFSDRPNLDR